MSDQRVRLVTLVAEDLREALRLEAAKRGVDMQDLVALWIEEHCAQSLADVRRRKSAPQPGKK